MSSNYDQQIDLQNVRAGVTAVLKLSYKATFDVVNLFLGGGLSKADIGRIEGKANGVSFFVDDGSLIGLRDAYMGVFVDPGVIALDFTEINTRGGAAAQYLASIPRNLLASLTFEIEIKATAAAGSTMYAEAAYRDPTPNPYILRRKDFNIPLTHVGDNDVMLPTAVNGGMVKRIWLHSPGAVDKIELRTNGTPRIRSSTANMKTQQKRNRLVPQANLDVIDFCQDGNLMNMLNTAGIQECLLRLTANQTGAIKGYIDYVDNLQKLS